MYISMVQVELLNQDCHNDEETAADPVHLLYRAVFR